MNYSDISNQLHTNFIEDFNDIFNKNTSLRNINNFIDKYYSYFRTNELVISKFNLDYRSHDIINFMKVYGTAHQLYVKSCKIKNIDSSINNDNVKRLFEDTFGYDLDN